LMGKRGGGRNEIPWGRNALGPKERKPAYAPFPKEKEKQSFSLTRRDDPRCVKQKEENPNLPPLIGGRGGGNGVPLVPEKTSVKERGKKRNPGRSNEGRKTK